MKYLFTLGVMFSLFMATGASAEVTAKDEKQIRQRLAQAIPGLEVTRISEAPFPDVYTVETRGQETLFTTADGSHLVVGELYQLTSGGVVNVTEQSRARQRAERIQAVAAEDLISYRPKGETKAVVNVFTDIDCPYCRKLHQEVPGLNEMGIQVNYLAFPRSGPNTPSFAKAVSAWCADDPAEAMNRAKSGRSLDSKTCDNPVLEQFQLGQQIGITGTPAIVLENGTMIGGYVPKERLAQALGLQ
ncbi:DsbC family protein [Hydrocarboniclastica marina]|uniref:Thiol:disulfide interchange protein n=1 Tax=Hydrocarboniclastica marina TaxID=2259620 RepID=A0A4P7XHI9_9ALTE|nr:DsbC family protein [Hydrocarboniclastica marina]QCF25277.1 DsbC family protein [Hydrocarboniclastica marina]